MKKLTAASVIAVAMVFGASVAQAEEPANCQTISTLAETIMKARQQGVPMSKVMDSDLDIVKTMAIKAYDKPRYSTPKFQRREIADFRDLWHLACVKARG